MATIFNDGHTLVLKRSVALAAGVGIPLLLCTAYLELSQRTDISRSLDVPVIAVAALVGGVVFAMAFTSRRSRILAGTLGTLALYGFLFEFSLYYVCYAFGACV